MSYFERINRFIEYERGQGRHWRKKSMTQLYYSRSMTGGLLYEYPILWIMTNQSGYLRRVVYEVSHNMGFCLYNNSIWFEYNVNHNASNMLPAVDSIRQFWG
ncbi:hypothetical protein [Xenorhabdus eapokensis]|uniref:Uncharacterized protein n=1 Tax=Xenorhabdus eapokensis TaxID=1873482 RepID=A0A1Q5TEZ6_9GAMM|nr:hypothetical protein [Xenorhabdus eapokensis]OKO98813.1 hypothetical protein Xedl_03777 [Xenorhabdus eapokensis]